MFSIDFFNADNMNLFWGYVQSLLKTVSPAVMLWAALCAVGLLIPIVIKAFKQADKDEESEDFEYKEY